MSLSKAYALHLYLEQGTEEHEEYKVLSGSSDEFRCHWSSWGLESWEEGLLLTGGEGDGKNIGMKNPVDGW